MASHVRAGQNPDLLSDESARECERVESEEIAEDSSDDDENEVPCGVFPVMEI